MGNPLQLHHAVYRIPDQVRSMINSGKKSFDKLSTWVLSLNNFSAQRSIVSCKGMLINSDSISNVAITSSESKL